jgi:hypothetical protein
VTRYDSETVVALEAWYQTTRRLRNTEPGSAEWHRLRMMAQDQHVTYDALIRQAEQPPEGLVPRESSQIAVRES